MTLVEDFRVMQQVCINFSKAPTNILEHNTFAVFALKVDSCTEFARSLPVPLEASLSFQDVFSSSSALKSSCHGPLHHRSCPWQGIHSHADHEVWHRQR